MPVEAANLQHDHTPLGGEWQIDPTHSSVGSVARHLMVAKVRGRFASFQGELHIDPVPERSTVAVTIQAASIDTGEPQRDEHLRSADFLDVTNHPTIEFHSTALRNVGDSWRLDGALTIRGTTRPVTLHLESLGVQQVAGSQVAGFTATTEIDRHDFVSPGTRPLRPAASRWPGRSPSSSRSRPGGRGGRRRPCSGRGG